MKSRWICLLFVLFIEPTETKTRLESIETDLPVTGNLFIITTDGFRWQELFNGADSILINDDHYTPDKETIKALYWSATADERRKKLMPFFWNVINDKGQIYGNRLYHNKVNNANFYSLSYPGYNELFTGTIDPSISQNSKFDNPNINVLEYLNRKPALEGKIAVFSSWDVFPYILNEKRNHLPINSGYEELTDTPLSKQEQLINEVQDHIIADKAATRYDELTFLTAKEYLLKNKLRVAVIGLGETDEFAHRGRYDLYLQQATNVDKMIAELWHWVQTTPGYKNNTTFLITTDHGRGWKKNKWATHGEFVSGSSQTWLAIMGPGIVPKGELKTEGQLQQRQVAQTIAGLMGAKFDPTTAFSLR